MLFVNSRFFSKYFCSADPAALTRIAFEFCEDSARNGVAYFEARFCPHLVCNPKDVPEIKPEHMVQAVIDGFRSGEEKYGVKVNSSGNMVHNEKYSTPHFISMLLVIL